MAKQNDLAARAQGAMRRPQPSTEGHEPAETGAAAPRTKPVRLSLDMSPQAYRQFAAYCADVATDIGKPRVAHTEVLRVLVDELIRDEGLRAAVAARVAARASK